MVELHHLHISTVALVDTNTKPHLKALISGSLGLEGLRCCSTFTLSQALLKKAILHHTRTIVKYVLAPTVHTYFLFENVPLEIQQGAKQIGQ